MWSLPVRWLQQRTQIPNAPLWRHLWATGTCRSRCHLSYRSREPKFGSSFCEPFYPMRRTLGALGTSIGTAQASVGEASGRGPLPAFKGRAACHIAETCPGSSMFQRERVPGGATPEVCLMPVGCSLLPEQPRCSISWKMRVKPTQYLDKGLLLVNS